MIINTIADMANVMKDFKMNGVMVHNESSYGIRFFIINPKFIFFRHWRQMAFIKRYFAFQDYLTENMTAGISRTYELM